jgi:Rieske Fe-S protein
MPPVPAPLDRRSVLGGLGCACAIGALSACSSGSSGPSGPLARLSDLDTGVPVRATAPNGDPVIVVRTGPREVAAFSATCTHAGCTVAPDGADLQCPCHGSRYDGATGAVVRGPAQRPLPPFAVRVTRRGTVVPA